MLSPEEFIMLHAEVPYNPQQAHEYYLQNRELKGRQPAAQKTTSSRSRSTAVTSVKKPSAPVLTSEQRQDAVNARVEGLQNRLAHLKELLQERIEAAQKKDVKKESKSGPDKKSDLSVQQKKEAAVRSKEAYKEIKKTKSAEEIRDSKMSTDEVKSQINNINKQLLSLVGSVKVKSIPKNSSQQRRTLTKSSQVTRTKGKTSQTKSKPKSVQAKRISAKVATKKVSEVKPTGNFLTRIKDWVSSLFD